MNDVNSNSQQPLGILIAMRGGKPNINGEVEYQLMRPNLYGFQHYYPGKVFSECSGFLRAKELGVKVIGVCKDNWVALGVFQEWMNSKHKPYIELDNEGDPIVTYENVEGI